MSILSEPKSCKIVLLGESGVGKTSIISRYTTGQFNELCQSTNGASYSSKTIKLQKLKKKSKIRYLGYCRTRKISFINKILL